MSSPSRPARVRTTSRTSSWLVIGAVACSVAVLVALGVFRVRRAPLYRAWREGWRRYHALTPEERARTLAELRGEDRKKAQQEQQLQSQAQH